MDVEAANAPEKKKDWACICQGCKKARKHERERIIELLVISGFEDAALILQLESSVSEMTKQRPKASEQST